MKKFEDELNQSQSQSSRGLSARSSERILDPADKPRDDGTILAQSLEGRQFGMEISANQEADFTAAMDADLLKSLLREHKIVVLRNFNPLDKDSLVEYAKKIGPLLEWDFGSVMEMRAQEEPKNYLFTNGRVPFHWDGAFHRVPRFLLFHCIEAPLPGCGGETIFSNTNRVWEAASPAEKELWQLVRLNYQTEKLAHYGGNITVPLVQEHPDTGERILRFAEPVPASMLNPVKVEVENFSETQAEKFIADIAARCYAEENSYTHTWKTNDFLIADNHALIHGRHAFKQFSPRHLRRIQIL